MSRVAHNLVVVPGGVNVSVDGRVLRIKGKKGELTRELHAMVDVNQDDNVLKVTAKSATKDALCLAGTTRALVQNMVTGVTEGFERKLDIVGVGYRAAVQGNKLNLTLGFSHPVQLDIPEGISVETPSQTEIIVRGADKQRLGQFAANIRAYRPPEPYKGKGVRYSNEHIVRKEAKKA